MLLENVFADVLLDQKMLKAVDARPATGSKKSPGGCPPGLELMFYVSVNPALMRLVEMVARVPSRDHDLVRRDHDHPVHVGVDRHDHLVHDRVRRVVAQRLDHDLGHLVREEVRNRQVVLRVAHQAHEAAVQLVYPVRDQVRPVAGQIRHVGRLVREAVVLRVHRDLDLVHRVEAQSHDHDLGW